MARALGPRPWWLTVLLHAVLLLLVVLDVRAAVFWARVGGSLGTPVAAVAGGIALLAVLLVAADLRRQVSLASHRPDEPEPPS